MLKEFAQGGYYPGTSIMHRLDPRTKIVLTLCFMAAAFLAESYPAIGALFLCTIGMSPCAGKPLRHAVRGIRPIICLALVAAACNLFFAPGTPMAGEGLLRHVSSEGVELSAKMFLRLILLMSGTSLLTATTTPLALTDGLTRLLKPLERIGVPVVELAMIASLALRFIPVIFEEAERIVKAQRSRSAGFAPATPLHRAASLVPLMVPLCASISRRGDALGTAMEARCYRGGAARSRMRPLAFSAADLACGGGALALLALLLLMERLHG